MVASSLLVAGFVASASASYLVGEDMFATLLKRQEPGTPAYNCHDNCGTAITVSKSSSDVCNDEVFRYDYANCLACAGPSNHNIWRYYGGTLSSVASDCGLSTETSSTVKEDVPEAKHPGDAASAPPSEEPASSTPAPGTTAPTEVEPSETAPAPAPTTEGAPTTGAGEASVTPTPSEGAPESTGEAPAAPTEVVESSAYATLTSVPYGTSVPSGTGSLNPSGNGTASFTASQPPQQTVNAASNLQFSNEAAMLGVMVMGAVYGLGN